MHSSTYQAIILAAGNGDRFQTDPPTRRSKLLALVAGTPLLVRTLRSAARAGVTDAHIVLGYDADAVQAAACEGTPNNLKLHFHFNESWHEENGRSLLVARQHVNGSPFALLMGDHIFEPAVLGRLLETAARTDEALLAVDSRTSDPEIVAEATKVRMQGHVVTAIGKTLDPYDALDTGLFVCQSSVFEATEESCASGDTTLSGGIARLAARGLVRGVDIGNAQWCDVDTIADLLTAHHLLAPSPA